MIKNIIISNLFLISLITNFVFVLLIAYLLIFQIPNGKNTFINNTSYENKKMNCNDYAVIYANMVIPQIENEKDFIKKKYLQLRMQDVFTKINDLCELDLNNLEKYKKLTGSSNGMPD